MEWRRKCAVAGSFYPSNRNVLENTIRQLLKRTNIVSNALGIVVPHAGYQFSGRFAAKAYSLVNIPETVIVLCPNHTGRGKKISIWAKGYWETPLGSMEIDEKLSDQLLSSLNETPDKLAHEYEHSIEVQLPFIYCINPKTKIVPICLGVLAYEKCKELGEKIANLIKAEKEKYLLVASTDMSHYISAEEASIRDKKALDKISNLNGYELYKTVVEEDISMCGFIPTTIVVEATHLLGAKKADLIDYGHSGEVTQDYGSVVAYASLLIH